MKRSAVYDNFLVRSRRVPPMPRRPSRYHTHLCLSVGPLVESAWAAGSAADVDAARIDGADQDPANWMTYGRTYSEQRFSPLARITANNVKDLGLAWYVDLDTVRGQEATPLVIDGVMYVSTAWSMVKAFDAKTGALLWSYDPQVPSRPWRQGMLRRGQSRAWPPGRGKIFVGTFDGRLVALDAKNRQAGLERHDRRSE